VNWVQSPSTNRKIDEIYGILLFTNLMGMRHLVIVIIIIVLALYIFLVMAVEDDKRWFQDFSKQEQKTKEFSVSFKSLKGVSTISSAVYYYGHILCLQEDKKLFVLDSVFNFAENLTERFSHLRIQYLFSYNDTILLSTGKELFYLDREFSLKKYTRQSFKYGIPYYNDSIYYVHACSVGEFGGAVFFWNKKTDKMYSYPATAVQQVLKFKGQFIVSSFLAHLDGLSDYLSIKDPTQLYELQDERQKRFCNWYTDVDSLSGKKFFDTITPPGVKYYADDFITRTLVTFPYNDNLYSIYCIDSATILAKHLDFKLIPVDTLLNKEILFMDAKSHLVNNIVVTAHSERISTVDGNGKIISYYNTGLVFIKGNKITFIEFELPLQGAIK
jgi:hypothetical protein